MNGYPYPVLTEIDSSYKEDIKFLIEFTKYEFIDNQVKLSLNIDLSSESLLSLIQQGYAEIVIKILTDIRSKIFHFSKIDQSISAGFDCEDIKANDTIKVTGYIVATKPFTLITNDEMLDYFGNDYSINLRKGDLLAVSNDEKLNYNSTNNDFIKIRSAANRNGEGIAIILSNDNFIEILVGEDFKHAYAVSKDPKVSPILNCHLIFEAIVYTLVEIAQNKEDFSEREWFRLFSQAYEATGETLDEFKEKAYDDSVDMSYVFKMAQLMISNSLETSVIKLEKMVEE